MVNQVTPPKVTVAGAMLGRASIDWPASESAISSGSIVENLTSFGAVMDNKGHTKCTEFLKWGAAGSSGTVCEPYAIQAKFPHPMIQVHYARGCSLAEAFYQSVHGPFHLLIVGDALCQPWAKRPTLTVSGLREKQIVTGPIQAAIEYGADVPVGSLEVFVDGVLLERTESISDVKIDSTTLADGFHEIRLVAIADDPIETVASKIYPVFVRNQGNRIDILTEEKSYDVGGDLTVSVKSNFGDRVEIMHNGRVAGKRDGKTGPVKIAAAELGRGPVTLMAVAFESDSPEKRVQSVPIELEITGPIADKVPVTSEVLQKQLGGVTER